MFYLRGEGSIEEIHDSEVFHCVLSSAEKEGFVLAVVIINTTLSINLKLHGP